MNYQSVTTVDSRITPGVRFTVAKMSFGRRLELMQRVRELSKRMEFLQAGERTEEKMDAALLGAEIDRLYLDWGLQSVSGLELDGVTATPQLLAEAGPENLFREALAAVQGEAGLSEEQQKN